MTSLFRTDERIPQPARPDYPQQAFLHASDAILVTDPFRDCILNVNRAACQLLGYEREELLGRTASALNPDEIAALIVFTQSVLEHGRGWTNEFSFRTKEGKALAVECSASSFESSGGPLLVITLRDREKLARLQEQAEANAYVRRGMSEWKTIEKIFQEIERENQLILRAAGEGIYGLNADGKTTFVNPAAERMLGWNAEELVGRDMHNVVHHSRPGGGHYPAKECPIYAAFRDGAVHHVDDELFWRKDGTAFPVEYTSTPIKDHGRLVGAVVLFRDISDRIEAEANLRSALAEVKELKHRLEMENAYLQEEIRAEHNYKEIVGNSNAIERIIQQIELVAPTDASVLITGETGTGKELVARAIHESSPRRKRPLIRVNCAAIPRDLFESEFFGHVKGAFTGAVSNRAGRFELADGGTLFLDEVGEIPLELQSKLLRVIQEGQLERLGDTATRGVDVRVIAATNRDLKTEVINKRFREDLYFRLNVFPIECVPLRKRIEDVPLLAAHFLERACHKLNKTGVRLSQADVSRLQAYDWPGNIRELENVIERAVIVSRHGRLVLDLPCQGVRPANAQPATAKNEGNGQILTYREMRRQERENILAALQQTNGKVFGAGGAAALLGVKPTTLASRIKRLGITKTEYRAETASSAG